MEDHMRAKVVLDRLEKGIEESSSKYAPTHGAKRAKIERILERARKTRNINIRIREHDLAQLKRRAEEEGVPYQTLISSVLHKYLSEKLVDEKDVLKSIELLQSRR
jgi:predicted DNA binding CopG/RHH family protein